MTKKIFLWEFVGLIGVIMLWTFLHTCYKTTGISGVCLISAVNGSIWEHVKIAFFSLLALYIVEAFFIARYCKNFWYGKMIGLVLVIIITLGLVYLLSNVVGLSIEVADVIAGILGFFVSQIVSYRILLSEVNHSRYESIYMSVVIILIIPFFVFTFYPIQHTIFKDLSTNAYGIFNK